MHRNLTGAGSGKGGDGEHRRRAGNEHLVRTERRATGGDGHHPWADAGRQPVPRQEVPHGKGAPESG